MVMIGEITIIILSIYANCSSKAVHSYNVVTKVWTPLADMPEGRDGHAAAYIHNSLIVCGGYTPQIGLKSKSCARLPDPLNRQSQWIHDVPDLPDTRVYFVLVPVNGRLLAIGGAQGCNTVGHIVCDGDSKDTVFAWTPGSDHWETLDNIKVAMRLINAVVV
jgi:hypothetical protein